MIRLLQHCVKESLFKEDIHPTYFMVFKHEGNYDDQMMKSLDKYGVFIWQTNSAVTKYVGGWRIIGQASDFLRYTGAFVVVRARVTQRQSAMFLR